MRKMRRTRRMTSRKKGSGFLGGMTREGGRDGGRVGEEEESRREGRTKEGEGGHDCI
jgi:hypothetical protein